MHTKPFFKKFDKAEKTSTKILFHIVAYWTVKNNGVC